MPEEENKKPSQKSVDIDTSGPGAEVDVAEEKVKDESVVETEVTEQEPETKVEETETVKEKVRQPFCNYLKTHYDLLENLAKGMVLDVSLKNFSEDDLDSLLLFGVEGFMKGRSLIGTPETCVPFIAKLEEIGINEVACLIDFVQDFDTVMESLPYLQKLHQVC